MRSTVVHSRIALGQMLLESGPDAPKLEKMVLMLVTGRTFEATATAEHKGFLNSNLVQKLNFESFFSQKIDIKLSESAKLFDYTALVDFPLLLVKFLQKKNPEHFEFVCILKKI